MWTLQGPRQRIWDEITAHSKEKMVRIKTKPSRALFLRLLDSTSVQEVYISAGLWQTVPAKVRSALEKAGVRVRVEGQRAGRPAQYNDLLRQKAIGLMQDGKTAKEISIKLSVPTTAIFYWKRMMNQAAKLAIGASKMMGAPDST